MTLLLPTRLLFHKADNLKTKAQKIGVSIPHDRKVKKVKVVNLYSASSQTRL